MPRAAAPYSIIRVPVMRARPDERGKPNRNTGIRGRTMTRRKPLVIAGQRSRRKRATSISDREVRDKKR
jgi:hypothetical protein